MPRLARQPTQQPLVLHVKICLRIPVKIGGYFYQVCCVLLLAAVCRCNKILASLAVDEPGENWVGEEYSWSYAQR